MPRRPIDVPPPHRTERAAEQCWRLVLQDAQGLLWVPIVSALDEGGAIEKGSVLFAGAIYLGGEALHPTTVHEREGANVGQ